MPGGQGVEGSPSLLERGSREEAVRRPEKSNLGLKMAGGDFHSLGPKTCMFVNLYPVTMHTIIIVYHCIVIHDVSHSTLFPCKTFNFYSYRTDSI